MRGGSGRPVWIVCLFSGPPSQQAASADFGGKEPLWVKLKFEFPLSTRFFSASSHYRFWYWRLYYHQIKGRSTQEPKLTGCPGKPTGKCLGAQPAAWGRAWRIPRRTKALTHRLPSSQGVAVCSKDVPSGQLDHLALTLLTPAACLRAKTQASGRTQPRCHHLLLWCLNLLVPPHPQGQLPHLLSLTFWLTRMSPLLWKVVSDHF